MAAAGASPGQAQRRRLAATAGIKPLKLPDCDFGPLVNFFGSYTGSKVGAGGWGGAWGAGHACAFSYLAQPRQCVSLPIVTPAALLPLQCSGMGWLVAPLNTTSPDDLYAAQQAARAAQGP